ncbi:MAG: ligase-associated DNA damage response endonuclease PdeM [Pseudomonadota bacterium]
MNSLSFGFADTHLHALGSGALWWPDQALLCVSDLHLGKSERMLRRGGSALPPYETRDTLTRLSADLAQTKARQVICLGDSFDDRAAIDAISEDERLWIAKLQAGRMWVWIEGNHDPGPMSLGGTHQAAFQVGALTFRHIAQLGAQAEVSGHYHPKAHISLRGRSLLRPAFLCDDKRLILPAYGTYTGGLRTTDAALSDLMAADARAILTGPVPTCVPMPR